MQDTQVVPVILKRLIDVCREDEKYFRNASDALSNPELKRIFRLYSQQRREFIEELIYNVLHCWDGNSRNGEKEQVLDEETWTKQCAQSEHFTLKTYEEILALDLPPDLKETISAQAKQIREACEYLDEKTDGSQEAAGSQLEEALK